MTHWLFATGVVTLIPFFFAVACEWFHLDRYGLWHGCNAPSYPFLLKTIELQKPYTSSGKYTDGVPHYINTMALCTELVRGMRVDPTDSIPPPA